MSCNAYMVLLLAVVRQVTSTTEVLKGWSGRGNAPVKMWSINAELDMDQETADVSVQGPRNMQEARNVCQYEAPFDNTQISSKSWHEDAAARMTRKEVNPTVASPARPQLVVTNKVVCCHACETPYAMQFLHALAHGLSMLVVLWEWVLLTAAIFVRFR